MVVPLAPRRRARTLRAAVDALNDQVAATPLPTPESLGWIVAERDEAGRPLAAACPRYDAVAAYVVGRPEHVRLAYGGEVHVYAASLEELLAGLATGFLPEEA